MKSIVKNEGFISHQAKNYQNTYSYPILIAAIETTFEFLEKNH